METTAAATQTPADRNESMMTVEIVTLLSVFEGGIKQLINMMDLDGDDDPAVLDVAAPHR